jgi:hypothetical protein
LNLLGFGDPIIYIAYEIGPSNHMNITRPTIINGITLITISIGFLVLIEHIFTQYPEEAISVPIIATCQTTSLFFNGIIVTGILIW